MERFAILRAVPGIDEPACCFVFHSAADRHCRFAHLSALSNIRADVQALTAVGLLDPTHGGLRADCDVFETNIAI
jgi:hypothetical protein